MGEVDKTIVTDDTKNEYFISYQKDSITDGCIVKAKDASTAIKKLQDDMGKFSLQYVNKL